MDNEMWAVQFRSYGDPEVLQVATARRPTPGPGELLVRVDAFSVNQIDLLARRGSLRGIFGRGFPRGTGVDFVGAVHATGPGTTGYAEGDRVWGYLGLKAPGVAAAGAEFVKIRAELVSSAPSSVPSRDAAGLPLVGLTAIQTLRRLRVTSGHRVLVIGGNGGVGSAAIQVAAALGAHVDAVVGSRPEVARDLGADTTYDYTATEPAQIPARYDAIFDAAGRRTFGYRTVLKPGGRMASVSLGAAGAVVRSVITWGPTISLVSGKPNADDLRWLAAQVDAGRIRPVIHRHYAVADASAAHRDWENTSVVGKVVVVAPEV